VDARLAAESVREAGRRGDLSAKCGGARQGAAYEDRINFEVDVNFEKLNGLELLAFHANGFQIVASSLGEHS
jgi:hypothetical protein